MSHRALIAVALGYFAGGLGAQNALLSGSDSQKVCLRMVQLMESTGAALPDLQLASAPLVAGAKHTLEDIQAQSSNSTHLDRFVRQTRAFLAISDATPKPYPVSDTLKQQLAELRDDAERLDAHFSALLAAKEGQLRSPDRDNVKRYAEENSRLQPPGTSPRVVFMGDSITDFWHLNEYFTGRDFVNRGISGQVTSEMLGRFKEDAIDLHPKAVLILAGTNDISRGTPLNIIENNLVMMAELAQANQIKVLIASVIPVSAQQITRPMSTIQQLDSWLKMWCGQSGYTYVDYYSKMISPNGYLQADLADDGLHPNGKGYRIMAPIALAAIDAELGKPPVESNRKRRIRVF